MDDDLLPLASEAFGDAFVVVQHLSRLTDARLADWELTTRQWLLLAVLARGFAGRTPSLSEAAGVYGSSRQNVKQIALGLEARGWLRLVPDPSDARATLLALTDKVTVFDAPDGVARGRALLETVFAGLAADEVAVLQRLLSTWRHTLAATPASGVPERHRVNA